MALIERETIQTQANTRAVLHANITLPPMYHCGLFAAHVVCKVFRDAQPPCQFRANGDINDPDWSAYNMIPTNFCGYTYGNLTIET